jgi:hypothetical protein
MPNEALLSCWGISLSDTHMAKIMSFKEKEQEQARATLALPKNLNLKRGLRLTAPCIDKLLLGVSQGCRNEAALRLSCFFLNFRGDDPDRVWGKVQDWNSRNKPPLSEAELRSAFISAQRHGYIFGCEDVLHRSFCDKGRCGIFSSLQKHFRRVVMKLERV